MMFALIDCNNFYASCERLFRPALRDKPIVILSNNDGCVIARSNEAKALGIPMGVPYFQIQALCKQYQVQIFSSNYTFYGDMSHRVMRVIEESWPNVEIYSIDEAFLDLRSLPIDQQFSFCQQLQQKVAKYTGIPVSIGIGATKTLAKLANHVAKRELKTEVYALNGSSEWLSRLKVGDVWGVGRRWATQLSAKGIYTAADLAACDSLWIKKTFNVIMQRTVMELNGIVCGQITEAKARKSIISSKSFGRLQTNYEVIAQAISSHCARAHEKLRQQKARVGYLSVSVRTNPFRGDLPQYYQSAGVKLINPSNDLCYLTTLAKKCLKTVFRESYHYQKVGIYFADLITGTPMQPDLFEPISDEKNLHTENLMGVMDKINHKFGRNTVHLAAEGFTRAWAMRSEMRSPNFTTDWKALPVVRA